MKYRTGLTIQQVKKSINYHKNKLQQARQTIETYESDYDSYGTLLTMKARYKEYYHELMIEECEQTLNYINSLNK